MHWSKRIVFLFTLLAFLSNLALALPTETNPHIQLNKDLNNKAQYEKHKPSEPCWLAVEAQEELEEAELEADLKNEFSTDLLTGYTAFPAFQNTFQPYFYTTKYLPGAVRNWGWSSISLNIFFQVFRI